MMQHPSCQQRCWLESILTIPLPRFRLGQGVELNWMNDDGVHHCERGIVQGLEWNPPHWEGGEWIYYIDWTSFSPAQEWLTLPHRGECRESELQALEVLS